MDRGDPRHDHETGITFNFDRPDNEPPQAILVVTPATADGAWQWEDLVGALNETLDLAKKRALEPAQIDPTPYARLLPATIMAVTLYGISITTALAVADGVLDRPRRWRAVPSSLPVGDIAERCSARLFPSVTTWNRLEGRPRTPASNGRCEAEVRDALWMLTKQWQMGEFRGSDAGSPMFGQGARWTRRA